MKVSAEMMSRIAAHLNFNVKSASLNFQSNKARFRLEMIELWGNKGWRRECSGESLSLVGVFTIL